MTRLFSLLALIIAFAGVTQLHAQPFTIGALPRTQAATNGTATFTIHVHADSTYSSSITFRASAPSLPGTWFAFSKTTINYPYGDVSLVANVTGRKIGGTHAIVIEGYNGPRVVRDTVQLNVAPASTAWLVFDTNNSPLPSNRITAIAIDRNGVGWIGTDNGLASFDGTTWRVYDSTNGFTNGRDPEPQREIDGIAVDSTNGVWVISNGMLHHFKNNTWTNIATPFGIFPTGEPPTGHIAVDRGGRIWIAGDNVLASTDGTTWMLDTLTITELTTVAIDGNGAIWIVPFRGQLSRFDGTYWTEYGDITGGAFGGAISRPNVLATAPQGNIWCLCGGGIAMFIGKEWKGLARDPEKFPGPGPLCAAFDPAGRTWIGNDGGLCRFDGTNSTLYTSGNSGLPDNYVSSIAAGRDNRIWLGTSAHGLAIIDGNTDPDRLYSSVGNDRASGSTNSISSIQPNPATTIARVAYTVQTATHVRIELYDARGTHVATVADAQMEAGRHEATISTHELVPGTYFVKLSAGNVVEARPLIVVH
ncbi:MAG: T9SS type A sorting domain-containing protein [Bacteroidetes bacterium]|nr:T9SS type A sorting domain-containing protein [Bacteroidota bacterium]